MTTPAGWYDDGSGDLRWWDGAQWTAHVRSAAIPAPAPQADAEPTAAPASSGAPAVAETEPFAPPYALPAQVADVGAAAPAAHPAGSAPGYLGGLSAVVTPTAPRRISGLGIAALVVAVLGAVLACVPPIAVVGWIALGLGLVVAVVSLFLRGAKWPGITAVGVTVLGAVVAGSVALISLGIDSIVEADPVPTVTPGERPPSDDEGAAAEGEDPSAIEGAEMVPFAQLEVGDCLPLVEYDSDEDIYELPVVPCDRPHTDEVFLIYDLDEGEFPGDDAVYDLAWDGCVAEFAAFVGTSYEESELDFYTYTPTKASWVRADDRTVHCILFSYEDVTGTLQGAGR